MQVNYNLEHASHKGEHHPKITFIIFPENILQRPALWHSAILLNYNLFPFLDIVPIGFVFDFQYHVKPKNNLARGIL